MTRETRLLRWTRTLHEALLACYPGPFRERFGAETREIFSRRVNAARNRGAAAVWLCILLAFCDVVASGMKERAYAQYRMASGSDAAAIRYGEEAVRLLGTLPPDEVYQDALYSLGRAYEAVERYPDAAATYARSLSCSLLTGSRLKVDTYIASIFIAVVKCGV